MRKMSALIAAVLAAALLLPASSGATRDAAATAPIEVGHIPECVEAAPAAVAVPGEPVTLDVTVLLDGVASSRGVDVMNSAATSYAPLGIDLAASYEEVSFDGRDAQGLIDQAKDTYGGARPAGSDVVLVLTSKNITADGAGDAVAGLADCIGGVAFPEHAFAVSEVAAEDGYSFGPFVFDYELSAKIAAHEVGHLMGAHHHYANCAEGVPSELAQGEVSPCTLMFNAVNPSSLNFSVLNGAVVAGHAQAYARP